MTLRDRIGRRVLESLIARKCKDQGIELPPMFSDAREAVMDELFLRYRATRPPGAFGDGEIVDSVLEAAKWLVAYIVEHGDELVALIVAIVAMF